jgi:type I restriction enzyme S subunit
MNFLDHIQLNPKVSLEKGKLYPFIEMSSVSTTNREPSNIDIKTFDSGVRFEDGDTVIARIEPCLQNGKKFFVKDIGKGFGSTEYLVFRPKDEGIDAMFLYYFMQTNFIRKSMIGSMTGSTGRQRVNVDIFNMMEIDMPSVEKQVQIGQILSAYDDLIENNQRQIKLLEEAAQRLYKEWFVDLRFPGYEKVEIIDGVPDGWKKGTLGNIADNVGKTEKKEKRDNYAYYLPIDCLPKKSLAYTDFNDIALAESSLIAFKANDILFGAMRPYFHKVVIARDEGLTRSTCFVINSKQDYMWSYLTMLLFSVDTINYATRISVGTTMPYVRWKDFVQMPVLIPNENVAIAFKKQFMSIADKITKLAKQNIYLSQARDRLLPKLMNGEIEV